MQVKPKTWEEAYEALKRKVIDPTEPDVDLSDLPENVLTADEIVSAQPLLSTTNDPWWTFVHKEPGTTS